MSGDFYTDDVTDVLDIFFERDGGEPDWAAIRTRLYAMQDSHYTVIVNLLRAVWAIYEVDDAAAAETMIFRMRENAQA